ncbi:dipeptidase [Kordiimonas laminariae]|uniref:dipeptidase n=1 Tax=Kordiimonas laminariae TaxID=2917717 RepID=UPI001FF6E9F6|nr:dipeptidase [Kordiimonas laminariae]MCK0068868.1 dipeptidase [Kordiimonas laminariae]
MKALVAGVSMLALAACGGSETSGQNQKTEAKRIALETIVIDTHIDVPYRLDRKWEDVSYSTHGGDFDYNRAVEGGLNAPFMSIYTPAAHDGTPKAKEHALEMIAIVNRMVSEAPEKYIVAKTVADVEQAFKDGKIALPLGMENGSPVSGDLNNLDYFYELGIRYITLAHSKANHISDSSYDVNRPNDGLSDFGKDAVNRMNELGIMVDISHVSDKAFWDVMEITKTPVIASHSSARKFTPGFERNMNDEMIKALTTNGSVIMINYGSAFITEEANQYGPKRTEAYTKYLSENGMTASSDLQAEFNKKYAEDNPYPFATLDDVLDHIDHVVEIAGIDYVGIGSDYDGVGDSLPEGLKDVSTYPNLVEGLLKRGYTEENIKKILSGNLLRVWRTVEAYAAAN